MEPGTPSYTQELLLKGAKVESYIASEHLARTAEILGALEGVFDAASAKEALFPYATEVGRGAVLWPLRVALSGKEKSPDPFTLCGLLGKEQTLGRISAARSMLQ